MNSSERSPAPYDLHLHSYWSYDATAEVEAHFKRARELGGRYIAITNILSTQVICKESGRYIGWPTIVSTRSGEST